MREGELAVSGYCLKQQVARAKKVEGPKLGTAPYIQACAHFIGRKRDPRLVGVSQGIGGEAQTMAKAGARLGGQSEEVIPVTCDCLFGDGFSVSSILHAQIEPDTRFALARQWGVGAEHDNIRSRVLPQALKGTLGQGPFYGGRQVVLDPGNILRGNHAQITTRAQLRVQHLGEDGGEPIVLVAAGQITESQHRYRAAQPYRRSCTGLRRWGHHGRLGIEPEVQSRGQQDQCEACRQPVNVSLGKSGFCCDRWAVGRNGHWCWVNWLRWGLNRCGLSPGLNDYRRDESISTARDCLYVLGCVGVVVKRLTHLADSDPKAVVKFDEGILWPQMLPQFLAGDDFTWPFHQHK